MPQEIRVYVPSKDKHGKELSEDQKSQLYIETVGTLVKLFGGATRTVGHGVWLDKDSKPMAEDVTIVSSYSLTDLAPEEQYPLQRLGKFIKDVGNQECVLISIKPVQEVLFI